MACEKESLSALIGLPFPAAPPSFVEALCFTNIRIFLYHGVEKEPPIRTLKTHCTLVGIPPNRLVVHLDYVVY